MGHVEQAAQAVCSRHVGTGRGERDVGAAWHLLARGRELNQLKHGAAPCLIAIPIGAQRSV